MLLTLSKPKHKAGFAYTSMLVNGKVVTINHKDSIRNPANEVSVVSLRGITRCLSRGWLTGSASVSTVLELRFRPNKTPGNAILIFNQAAFVTRNGSRRLDLPQENSLFERRHLWTEMELEALRNEGHTCVSLSSSPVFHKRHFCFFPCVFFAFISLSSCFLIIIVPTKSRHIIIGQLAAACSIICGHSGDEGPWVSRVF